MADPAPIDLRAHAQALLDDIAFMTLGTVDADGRPWTTPVYFAASGLRELYWVSSPDSLHSRNLSTQPEVSLVVFDSTVAPYHGEACYARASARELSDDEIEPALEVYPGPTERGATAISKSDVTGASAWRLYRAEVSELWVLCPRERGRPCVLHGRSDDHRARVE